SVYNPPPLRPTPVGRGFALWRRCFMKSIVTIAFTMTLALSAGSAFADDCTRPPAPAIPSGAAATQEDMIAAQSAVKKFLADSETFRNCLQAQEALVPKE